MYLEIATVLEVCFNRLIFGMGLTQLFTYINMSSVFTFCYKIYAQSHINDNSLQQSSTLYSVTGFL